MAEELLPQVFRKSPDLIATYDFFDVDEGTGKVGYYAANSKAVTTPGYYLTKTALYSNDLNIQAATTGVSPNFAKNIDVDFDLKLNLPKTVKGFIRGNITLGGRTTSAEPNKWYAYAIIKLRKWDGTSETELANTQTETKTGGSSSGGVIGINTKQSKIMNFTLDATAGTNFKAGETLRITVEIWSHDDGGSNTGFGCDPKGRTDVTAVLGGIIEDAHSTIFYIEIPYKIN